ncbi:MAG: UDP-N-acetylglucosamine 1-carboxyvinyltransferase [Defluviitaleaceae bacterium]|nr:UDP-N-acetylglucosamine 1-carboxyvinyltransferase [Defluviitaleaceae bacterium]MCL2836046.1 UDP-N-acetylglucosamine 1-carboxyvinyltransferase [Defluviitaleaceae bacterium]
MGEYHVRGGLRIAGQITPGGAKNAVLPILSAAVLNSGKSIIHNVPEITDVFNTLDILRALGCEASFRDGTVTVDSGGIGSLVVPAELAKLMRSSILFLGSMLGRFGEVELSFPGGCSLGARNFDYHLEALRMMGADVIKDCEKELLLCSNAKLTGQQITLPSPSVGATENILLAAVLAEGETVIRNAALEPEIVELADYLIRAGAKVRGAGTGTIVIEGVKRLHDASHSVIPDRIVAGTYLCAAAMTGGELLLTGVITDHIRPIYTRLSDAGCTIKDGKDYCWLRAPSRLQSLATLTTEPHPGFPKCNKGRCL